MYKRILTIQDISCVGQCSLGVALPILSVCGIETAVLPGAVLSTHTGEFKNYTFRDLSEDIPEIQKHWTNEGICFDAFYTGYLSSVRQIEYVKELFSSPCAKKNSVKIVDPAMADNGCLYTGFDEEYVFEMRKLCALADVIVPNLTEACILSSMDYYKCIEKSYIHELIKRLRQITNASIILTGVSQNQNESGVIISQGDKLEYYSHEKISGTFYGTGDIFSSVFTGAYLNGFSIYDAVKIAADFTLMSIKNTVDDKSHWYGVKFEPLLCKLIDTLKG